MVLIRQYMGDIDNYIFNDNQNAEELFLKEITNYGLQVKGYIEKDKIVRVDTADDKKGKESGWYFYSEFPSISDPSILYGVGSYGSWKIGDKNTFNSREAGTLSSEERSYYFAKVEKMKQDREAEQLKIYDEKAKYAMQIWGESFEPTEHEYLNRKKVKAYNGVRISKNGDLVIPVCYGTQLTSLQFIKPDGSKKFLGGGKIKGCYFKIKGDDSKIYIAEGYATAASIAEATGNVVYVCFNAGNIYEVASYVTTKHINSKIIIAGDNDKFNDVNVGANKSTQAAEGLGIEVILPSFEAKYDDNRPTDFNDYANIYGIDMLKKLLNPINNNSKLYENKKTEEGIIIPPEGILRDIYNYYNATSGIEQKGFSIQTALALGSIVCARNFKTNFDNYSSLYFLNIAKSGTGKEHCKNIIEKILIKAGMMNLIGGDGYTSQGGLFTGLLLAPKHITIIDEFGRYLEAANNKSNTSQKEVNTRIMEVFGRCNSIMRSQTYSTMTLKENDRDVFKDRYVYNPALTLVGLSTPSTFFNNITSLSIFDGFLNRFLINISNVEPQIRSHKEFLEVPDNIIEWIKNIINRGGNKKIAPNEIPNQNILYFSKEAVEMQKTFQQELLNMRSGLEKIMMDEMLNRSNEISMRISLICSLARDYQSEIINEDDMKFSIDYVRKCLLKTIDELKMNVSGSDYERQKKEILKALREISPNGISLFNMLKTPPFSKYNRKVLTEIIKDLVECELIKEDVDDNKGRGRHSLKYFALC